MTTIDINKNLAEDAIIAAGKAIDRLKGIPAQAVAEARLLNGNGQDRYGYEAVRDMALELYALADMAVQDEVRRRLEEKAVGVARVYE